MDLINSIIRIKMSLTGIEAPDEQFSEVNTSIERAMVSAHSLKSRLDLYSILDGITLRKTEDLVQDFYALVDNNSDDATRINNIVMDELERRMTPHDFQELLYRTYDV